MFMDRIKEKAYQRIIKSRVLDIIILIILAIIGHRAWFGPGILDFGEFDFVWKEALRSFFSLPYIWVTDTYLGAYNTLFYTYPQLLLSGLIASLGFGHAVIERVVYFFPYLFLSLFSMYYFSYVLFKKRIICFFATLFFVFNTYILQIVAGGVMDGAVAYSLSPLILAFFIKGFKDKQIINGFLTGVFLSLCIVFYPPTAYLVMAAMALFFLALLVDKTTSKRPRIISLIGYLLFTFSISIIFHFYWILPTLFIKAPGVIPGHESIGWLYTLSYAKLSHALSIYSVWWPPGSQGVQAVRIQYFLISVLVFIGIISGFKDKNVRLLAIIALISVFFAKGTNRPFGQVYVWFFRYFPGGSMFRVPGKFHCLTNLAYAPLLGIGVDFLANVLRKIESRKLKITFKRNILKPIFLFFIFCVMLYLVFPAFQNKMGGTFQTKQIPKEYREIKQFIKEQKPGFRTFWRPRRGRFAFYSRQYPLLDANQYHFYSSESARYYFSDNYNPYIFEETNSLAKILGILNVKYCFLPLEEEYLLRGKEYYIETFDKQVGLKKIKVGENIEVFENQYLAPRFFATDKAALVVGGRKALFLLASLENMDLRKWAIFFSDQLKQKSNVLLDYIDTLIFYDKDINDLALGLIDEEYRVDLTQYAKPRVDDDILGGWGKNVYPSEHTFDGSITHNPKGVIYRHKNVGTDIASKLNTPISIKARKSQDYEVWIRAGKGPDRGKLSILLSQDVNMERQATSILQEIDLKDIHYSLQWIKVKDVHLDEGEHFFQIVHPTGPAGLIDQFVVLPKKIIDSLRKDISKIMETKDVALIKEADKLMCKVSVPKDGRYRLALKLDVHNFSGNVIIKFDGNDIKQKELYSENGALWIETDTIPLKKGESHIAISTQAEGKIELKQIVLYRTNRPITSVRELFINGRDIPVEWAMINPTKYEVSLETDRPAFLLFSEGYDSHWTLNLKNPLYSVNAYSLINSFFINQPQKMHVIVEFRPQRLVYRGLLISGLGLILLFCFSLFLLRHKVS